MRAPGRSHPRVPQASPLWRVSIEPRSVDEGAAVEAGLACQGNIILGDDAYEPRGGGCLALPPPEPRRRERREEDEAERWGWGARMSTR
ncbi:hypothetical protein KM043_004967 [Ampulex compressa]|nr:hypothetical protein KM043_004967 [Ampulex compressa]